MPILIAHPVRTLREQATALEAALSVCLASAKPRAVHKLRTSTRRLEAQVRLLAALKGLPPHRKLGEKVLRQITKVRREAGRVRDLDVQIKLLQSKTKHVPQAVEQNNEGTITHEAQWIEDLQRMIATRITERDHEATKLMDIVKHRQAKISAALEGLLEALKPAESFRLSASELIRIAEKEFARNRRALKADNPSDNSLHSIRKAAKQVRYLTETSGSRAAVETARRYEHLQEAGGRWHDWFDLAKAADKELGGEHATSAEFAALRDRRLASYRALLEQFK